MACRSCGGKPARVRERSSYKCLTCGRPFSRPSSAQQHRDVTGHVVTGLRGASVDPFVAAPKPKVNPDAAEAEPEVSHVDEGAASTVGLKPY